VLRVSYAVAQAIGARENQEDACAVVSDGSVVLADADGKASGRASGSFLGIVCDGMGGHSGGEVAAQVAVTAFVQSVNVQPASSDNTNERLCKACEAANAAIEHEVHERPDLADMGTTLVAAEIGAGVLNWVSVGDSHLLLMRGREIIKLNADHSMRPTIDRMVERGILSREEAMWHPDRNALRSVLMGSELELIDSGAGGWPLLNGDVIVIASDGVDVLQLSAIQRWAQRWRKPDLVEMAQDLVTRACAAGGKHQDNTTVIIARFEG
jgi:PPM family protein phosphatase